VFAGSSVKDVPATTGAPEDDGPRGLTMDANWNYRVMADSDYGLSRRASAGPTAALLDEMHGLTSLPEGEARASLRQVHDILLRDFAQGRLRIYEAGGGSTSFLPPSLLARADVTVVDIDPVQLENNAYAQQKVLGDIQALSFPADSFDLVICYNVIEHLPDVESAMRRFAGCLRSGGMILLGAPHPHSLSGVVTRFSPHWFHVWYYRHILGHVRAGEPGEPPFPVHYHRLVLPRRMVAFAASLGFEVVHQQVYESPRYPEMRSRLPWLGALIDAGARVLNAFTLNRKDVRRGDYHLVLRKS
jgi:SAM-dependent methyltransferase